MISWLLVRRFNKVLEFMFYRENRIKINSSLYPTLSTIMNDRRLLNGIKRPICGYDDHGIIGNFIFMSSGIKYDDGQKQGLTVYVKNAEDDIMEVFGLRHHPLMYSLSSNSVRHWRYVFMFFGWKHKGPWMSEIKNIMVNCVNEFAALKQQEKEQEKMKRKERYLQNAEAKKRKIDEKKAFTNRYISLQEEMLPSPPAAPEQIVQVDDPREDAITKLNEDIAERDQKIFFLESKVGQLKKIIMHMKEKEKETIQPPKEGSNRRAIFVDENKEVI